MEVIMNEIEPIIEKPKYWDSDYVENLKPIMEVLKDVGETFGFIDKEEAEEEEIEEEVEEEEIEEEEQSAKKPRKQILEKQIIEKTKIDLQGNHEAQTRVRLWNVGSKKIVAKIYKKYTFKMSENYFSSINLVPFSRKLVQTEGKELDTEIEKMYWNWTTADKHKISPELYFMGFIREGVLYRLCVISEFYETDLHHYMDRNTDPIKDTLPDEYTLTVKIVELLQNMVYSGFTTTDIKPENIVLSSDLDVKLIDFDPPFTKPIKDKRVQGMIIEKELHFYVLLMILATHLFYKKNNNFLREHINGIYHDIDNENENVKIKIKRLIVDYRGTINHYFKKYDGYRVDDVNELFNMMTTVIIFKNKCHVKCLCEKYQNEKNPLYTNIADVAKKISRWNGGKKNKTKKRKYGKRKHSKKKHYKLGKSMSKPKTSS
jgi:hypothetical protein